MNRIPPNLFPEDDDILSADLVRGLATASQETTVLPGADYLLQPVPGQGVRIIVRRKPTIWEHPWMTSLQGSSATVRPGLVNTIMPWLADSAGPLRALDGLDTDLKKHKAGVPKLELKDTIFDKDGYSFIVVRATVDKKTGVMLKPAEGGLTIAQTNEVTWLDGASLDRDGVGDCPIAFLRRAVSAKTGFGKVFQIRYFPINHRYQAGENGGEAKHWFLV